MREIQHFIHQGEYALRAIPKLLKDSVFSLFILARSPTAKKEEADPIDEAAGDQVI